MTATVPVVVVGAGPTGLVAATLLAQYGVRSIVLERYPEPYRLPRGVHVDDEVLRILQRVGIAEEFAQISRPARGLRLLDARHRVIAEFRRDLLEGVHGHPQANLFDQPDLERLLRENLSRYPEVELRTGVEVIGVAPELSPVLVRWRDLETGIENSIAARAVLGCDGANSPVRGFIGSRLEDLKLVSQRVGQPFEERWLVVDVWTTLRFPAWDGVDQVCDPQRAATFMQIGPERYRWEFRMHPGESALLLGAPQRLRALINPWLSSAIDSGSDGEFEVRRAAEYTFRAQLADRWRSGGVFLLGDAAHLTPPFIGQGMGAGLRDAQNLAWKLAWVFNKGVLNNGVLNSGTDEQLLDSYQAEREPHARALIRLAVVAGWAMTGGQDRAAAIRRLVLAVGCRIPGVASLILRTTSPRLEAGRLVHRLSPAGRMTRPHRDLAGTLCPQPWVVVRPDGEPDDAHDHIRWRAGPSRRRLDDVLGPSFALLVDGPVDDDTATLAGRMDARMIQLSDRVGSPIASTALVDSSPTDSGATVIVAPELRRWMARSRVRAVLLRPDRVVLATWPSTRWRRPPPDMVAEPVERTLGPAESGP